MPHARVRTCGHQLEIRKELNLILVRSLNRRQLKGARRKVGTVAIYLVLLSAMPRRKTGSARMARGAYLPSPPEFLTRCIEGMTVKAPHLVSWRKAC